VSLDWDVGKCADYKEKQLGYNFGDNESLNPMTNSLAWGAFCGVHLGGISTKNIDEWIWRIEYLKLINRPWMTDGRFPTVKDLEDHVDFNTNCYPEKTRKQWLAFQTKCLSDNVSRNVDKMYASDPCVA
jgi:hypothetical protein